MFREMVNSMRRAEQARQEYRQGSTQRMEPIRQIGERALGRLEAYDRGEDVASIHPMLAAQMGDISKNYQALTRMTGGMGTSALAQKDPRYMDKMQAVGLRDLAKAQGGMLASAGAQSRERDLGEFINAQGSMIGEERFGLGLFDQGFNQATSALGGAGQWRSGALNEAQRQNMMLGNITGLAGAAMGMISDERVKSNKKPSKYGLNEIRQLKTLEYDRVEPTPGANPREVGFSANQMAKVMPELSGETPEGLKTVDYQRMTAVLADAVVELDDKINSLKKKKGKSDA